MAGKSKKQKKDLILGIIALGATLAVLLVIAFTMPGFQDEDPAPLLSHTEPTETEPTDPTEPPVDPNPYGPTDFQYDGRYLTCLAGESMLGIDVSAHQKEIDWEKVAQAGVEFVMIRVGYRGYKTGAITKDAYADQNYLGAKAAGLQVGVYFFSQAISVMEAREEALWLMDNITGWELDFPVVYDWETVSKETARTTGMTRELLTQCTIAFCEQVKTAGYTPMVYFNRHQGNHLLKLWELEDYPFWLALYNDRMTYPNKVEMWQYTNTGYVPGIETHVDINLYIP